MLLSISYCEGYGWHCGRLLRWIVLLFVGIPLAFLAVLLDEVFRVLTRLPIPVALCVPLLFVFLLRRRLKRKLNGEPFAVSLPAFFMDDMSVLLIRRGHRHFRALVMLELFIWGSVIISQLGIIGVFYQQRMRHDSTRPYRNQRNAPSALLAPFNQLHLARLDTQPTAFEKRVNENKLANVRD